MRTILEFQEWLIDTVGENMELSLGHCAPSNSTYYIGKPLIKIEFNIDGCDYYTECVINPNNLKWSFDKAKQSVIKTMENNE